MDVINAAGKRWAGRRRSLRRLGGTAAVLAATLGLALSASPAYAASQTSADTGSALFHLCATTNNETYFALWDDSLGGKEVAGYYVGTNNCVDLTVNGLVVGDDYLSVLESLQKGVLHILGTCNVLPGWEYTMTERSKGGQLYGTFSSPFGCSS